jgi:PKD repeat protein
MVRAESRTRWLWLCLVALMTTSSHAIAGQATVGWDYSATGAAGFAVYCGSASAQYTNRWDAGNASSVTITNLTAGATYYCASRAYDASKVEGAYSNEIKFTVPGGTTSTPTSSPPPTTTTSAPVANFSASPSSGTAPVTVVFTNTSTGTVTSWSWTFGDGGTSTVQSPSHTYSAAGNYTVTLKATNAGGTSSKTATITVTAPTTTGTSTWKKPGLVAAYSFSEGTGTSTADTSGLGNNGVLTSASWSTKGRFGNALSLSGNGWVTVKDAASLHLSTMTLEAWVSPSVSLGNWADVLMKETSGGSVYYLTASSQWGVPIGGFNIGGEKMVQGSSMLAANVWTHLATTYDGATMKLYVNGALVASRSQTGTVASSTGPLRIGGDSIWGEYFTGLIDEVRVYNRALSQAEIQSDMTTAIGK